MRPSTLHGASSDRDLDPVEWLLHANARRRTCKHLPFMAEAACVYTETGAILDLTDAFIIDRRDVERNEQGENVPHIALEAVPEAIELLYDAAVELERRGDTALSGRIRKHLRVVVQ